MSPAALPASVFLPQQPLCTRQSHEDVYKMVILDRVIRSHVLPRRHCLAFEIADNSAGRHV